MTRLLYLPDDHTVISQESPLSPADLQIAVEMGAWKPPIQPESGDRLIALTTGGLVIVMPETLAAGLSFLQSKRQGIWFTKHQHKVLEGMAEGLSVSQIAHDMGISERQVRRHIKNIKDRLGASTSAQALGRAAILGLIEC